jgi:hypothetical protein
MIKRAYAGVVLWLIRPALKVRESEAQVSAVVDQLASRRALLMRSIGHELRARIRADQTSRSI